MAVSTNTVPASSLKETTSQDPTPYYSAEVALAREAVRAGLIKQDVLDHLTSLNPQVPSSMKYRYLLMHLHEAVKDDEHLFARMVQILTEFQPKLNTVTTASVKFGLEHIPELIELLVKYSYEWHSIGTALRFQPQDLKNIQANHATMVNSAKCCLLSLIEEWIGKKHEHTLPPTKGNLERALSSLTVGLGALACELKTMFVAPKRIPTEISLDLSMTSGRLIFTPTHSQNMNIHVEENKSALLTIQVTPDDTGLNLKYKWLINELATPGSSSHTGITTPMLCISNAHIDMDGFKYKCVVTACTRNDIVASFTTEYAMLRVNCPLDKFTYSLARMYTDQPEVPRDTWPPISSKKHINLALIQQDYYTCLSIQGYNTIRGDMDDILQHKEMIEYDELFRSIRCGQVIFVEGRPGSGKTTFVHKITRDWGFTPTGGIKLMLLVSLRVLNNKLSYDLTEILKLFKNLNVSKELIEEREGRGVCFIFDGLDEYTPPTISGEKSVVYRIIDKEYLNQSTVIVASRPAAIAELRWKANKVIEVIGFKKEQICEYFDHYPFSDQSKSVELKAYLSVHPNILHMCYLPVHAAMVGFLFQVTGKVPQTETEIYTHFTRLTLKRNLEKSGCTNIDVHNLSGEEDKIFNKICIFALEKTIVNEQVLHQNEVKSLFKGDRGRDISLGLITIDLTADLYGYKDIHTFLHLTFQEYLAAYHISRLSDEEQYKLIQEHGNTNHMLTVWKFFCGLVKFTFKSSMFKVILNRTEGKNLFNIQCAYESQQLQPCTQLLKKTNYIINLADKYLTTSDFTAMGYIMNKSVVHTQLSLTNCKINIEAIDSMLLQMCQKSWCLLQKIYILSCDIDMECVKKLLINTKLLQKLSFKNNKFSQSIQQVLALTECLKSCTELKELDISGNGLSDGMTLATGLKSCSNLQIICLRDNNITTDDIRAIFEEIRCCKLKVKAEDITEGNDITNTAFLHILQCCTNLQSLEMTLHPKDIKQLCLCCEYWKSLKELEVYILCHVSDSDISSISNCLHNFRELQVLVLNNFKISDRGADRLAKGLSHCPELQILDLSNCKIIGTTVSSIYRYCTRLKKVYLINCIF